MTDNRWIHQSSRHAEFPRSLEKITQEGFSVLMKLTLRFGFPILIVLASLTSLPALSQDWVHTGSGLGNARIRLAASDFKAVGADAQTPALKATFDEALAELDRTGGTRLDFDEIRRQGRELAARERA